MEMHQIRYFVAVAEELHFGRAAQRENVSQPPLSHQIKKLEAEMGVLLFQRTKRVVKLSEAGLAFLPAARAILATSKAGRRAAQRAQRGEIGIVTVGFVHSASITYLPTLIGPFRQRFPDVQIQFQELTVSEQITALQNGVIDVGLVRPPILEAGFDSFTVMQEDFCIAVPNGHALAQQQEVTLQDIRNERYVFYPKHRSPAFHEQLMNMCATAGFTPEVGVEANTMYTAIGLVGTGAGIAIVPRSIAVIAIDSVVYLNLIDARERAELCMAYDESKLGATALSLIGFARETALEACPQGAGSPS